MENSSYFRFDDDNNKTLSIIRREMGKLKTKKYLNIWTCCSMLSSCLCCSHCWRYANVVTVYFITFYHSVITMYPNWWWYFVVSVFKSLTLKTIHGRRIFHTWRESERLIAQGHVDVHKVITHRFPMSQFEEAFSVLFAGTAIKIVLDPWK